jgi:hypothetical protein
MARKNYVAIPPKSLKTDVLSTDSTFKIRDILWYTGSDGVAVNLAASDFGSDNVGYGVFEPKTAREEWFTFSSANMATAVTGGLTITARGLIRTAPYTTEATARKFNHESGSQVLLYTNSPAFYDDFANKDNDETITGLWTFPTGANYPVVGSSYSAPTSNLQIVTKQYADGLAIAGAPDGSTTVKGIFEEATVAEQGSATATGATGARLVPANANLVKTSSGASDENKIAVLDASGTFANGFIDKARTWGTVQSFTADNCQITSDANSANDAVRFSQVQSLVGASSAFTTGEAVDGSTTPQVVCIKASDGLLYKADANDATLNLAIGFVNTNALITTTPTLVTSGFIGGFTGLTQNATYYVSDTAGSISTTQSTTCAIPVGKAVSTTTLQINLGKRVATGSITHASAVSGTTQDVTTTIGFRPTKITLGVVANITGSTSAGKTRATLVYMGTTQISKGAFNEDDASATAVTGENIVDVICDTGTSGVGAYARSSGGNRAEIVVTLNSVSATGFVTRIVNATQAGAGGNSSGTLTFIAEE